MSRVEENMKRAVKRDAVLEQKFYFRKNLEKGKLTIFLYGFIVPLKM